MGQDFIMLLRTVHTLKFRNYLLLDFPFNNFGPLLMEIETTESETADKGVRLVKK